MTPKEARERSIEHELANIRTYERWKRDARKLAGPTPADLARFDQWMDRWIAGCRDRIERLRNAQ
jgi:hypothetical protein